MTFDSFSLLQRLYELEQQITVAPQYDETLHVAWDGHDLQEVLCATMDAARYVRALAVTAGRIKAQIVPTDGLGVALESLSELVLRAVRMVVLAELSGLRDVACESFVHGRPRMPPWAPFREIDDLTVYVHAELHQITEEWGARRGQGGTERAAYRAALRAAHASMRQLGNASLFAHFLLEGRTRFDWPLLQTACARMLAALTVRIDLDPDMPLLTHARPLHELAVEWAL